MGMRSRKSYSLKKQLAYIIGIGYMAIVLLLLVLDFYLISTYRVQLRQDRMAGIEKYVGIISDSINTAEGVFYDLCLNNQEFLSLALDKFYETQKMKGLNDDEAERKASLERYNTAYNLNEQVKNKILIHNTIEGIAVFYDQCHKRWYVPQDKQNNQSVNELVDMTFEGIPIENYGNGWHLMQNSQALFYMKYYRQKSAAFAAYVRLTNIEFDFKTYMKKTPLIVLTMDGSALSNSDLWSEVQYDFDKSSRIQSLNGYSVYSMDLGSSDIVVHMFFEQSLWDYLNPVQLILVVVTGLSLGFIVLGYVFIRRHLLGPLKQIMDSMDSVRRGNWEQSSIDANHILEFEELDKTFHVMISEIKKLKIDSYEEKIARQKAQMQYLQLQLKPHFFLNCLKTMNALFINRKYDRIQELIFNISEHLRFLLNSDRTLVTLKKEMEYVSNYMELQSIMSLRAVAFVQKIDEEAWNYMIPPLAVQTFVENSFKYARLPEGLNELTITVSAQVLKVEDAYFMDLSVRDDGCGYPAGMLEMLREGRLKPDNGSNIGIYNLCRRFELLYGEKAEYFFDNNGGAVSEIVFPTEKEAGMLGEVE